MYVGQIYVCAPREEKLAAFFERETAVAKGQ